MRRKIDAALKVKIALEALREQATVGVNEYWPIASVPPASAFGAAANQPGEAPVAPTAPPISGKRLATVAPSGFHH